MRHQGSSRIPSFLLLSGVLCLSSGSAIAAGFLRGDVDGRIGISISDPIRILRHLFAGKPLGCEDAADVDDDGLVASADAVRLLEYLFLDGPPPAPPFPEICGVDPTEDALGCETGSSSGDGIFFVADRSGGFSSSGGLAIAKREVILSLEQFSACVEFGVVFFDANLLVFPSNRRPIQATQEARTEAITFINSVAGGSGTCVREGLLAALDLAELSSSPRNTIIYFGDGGGTCRGASEAAYLAETLRIVGERNQGRARINVIAIGSSIPASNDQFLRDLAAQNGGSYARIVR